MRTALTVSCLLLFGCPPKPVPVVNPDLVTEAPACTAETGINQEALCDGFFTQDGVACARCPKAKGCVDPAVIVYCAMGPCATDPRCTYVSDPTLRTPRK